MGREKCAEKLEEEGFTVIPGGKWCKECCDAILNFGYANLEITVKF